MALSCIVFDCDGIILESVDAKNAAFGRICDEIDPAHTGAFVDYVSLHGGVSRFEKFSWLVNRIHGRDIAPEESRAMGEKFSRYCLEAVLSAPLVPGFLETAKRWRGVVPMFVASGTPDHELGEVIRAHGLDRFFAGVHGTPPAKAALLRNIVRGIGADPKAVVMVGDSKTDRDAAVIAGTRFYGRGAFFRNGPCPWGEDLTKLNAYLENMAAGTNND